MRDVTDEMIEVASSCPSARPARHRAEPLEFLDRISKSFLRAPKLHQANNEQDCGYRQAC